MSVYFNGKKVSIASTTKVYGGKYNVTAEDKEDGTQKIIINTTPTSPAIVPTGIIDITENGQVDVTKYAFANVNVNGDGGELPDVLNKTVTTLTAEDLIGTTQIPNYAFQDCIDLTSVEFPSTLQTIGNYAFQRCSKLTSVDIPSSVTSIGSSAFSNCSNLISITIPDSVTSIGNGTFSYCSSLTSITIPDSVTSIGSFAFQGCSGLTSMTILATTPPTLGGTNAISSATTKIYIPAGTLSAYKSATNWSNFADLFEELPS